MSDYISREAAIAELRKAADCANCDVGAGGLCGFCDIENAARLINGIPAADVEPVRHGRWEPGNQICPVCGEDKFKDLDADIWSDWTPPRCPNCGAKMKLEDETNDD